MRYEKNNVFSSLRCCLERHSAGAGQGKILIAYFSWGGNTREMAKQIKQQTGGDLFEIDCNLEIDTLCS